MQDMTLEQKQQQFHEFFTIKHVLNVNIKQLPDDFVIPEQDELLEHMPYAFRMASEMAELEAKALRPLRALGDQAKELLAFLNHQSKKVDLMMSYILHQQDEETERFNSIEFGGGGIAVSSSHEMQPGTLCQLKIFIEEEAAAVFCYGEIISCEADADTFKVALIFRSIREQDQELLVRSSLHLQTKQLKQQHRKNK